MTKSPRGAAGRTARARRSQSTTTTHKPGASASDAQQTKPPIDDPATPSPTVTVSPDGDIIGVFDASQVAGDPPLVGITLDGRSIGCAQAQLDADGGELRFSLRLPRYVIGQQIDIVDTASGRRLLTAPLDVSGYYDFEIHSFGFSQRMFHADVSVRCDLDPALPVAIRYSDAPTQTTFARLSEPDEVPEIAEPDDLEPGRERRRYVMRTSPPTLLRVDEEQIVTFELACTMVDIEPITLTARRIGLAGYVEITEGPHITGWAVNLDRPNDRVEVHLLQDDRVIATTVADTFREDIRAAGFGDGCAAFSFDAPESEPGGPDLNMRVVIAGSRIDLCGSPFVREAPPAYVGFFDVVEGPFIGGWVINMADPDTPLQVEAICEGRVIGSGTADLFRQDVRDVGMPTARCGFRFVIETSLQELFDRDIYVRIVGTDMVVSGSPRQPQQNDNITHFLSKSTQLSPHLLGRVRRRMNWRTRQHPITIIMPVYNTKRDHLIEALRSVQNQWCGNWELVCIDDGSTEPHVREILRAFCQVDQRARVLQAPANMGIAKAVNFGIRAARCDYLMFMDHDDFLEPDAIYHLARTARETGADLIYGDEVITTHDINSIVEVRARPTFSYDYYLSHPYFVHPVCVRTALAQQIAGYDENLAISADVDFVLRILEVTRTVAHVPVPLYRWRTHGESTGFSKKETVMETMRAIIGRHLHRMGTGASVANGLRFNEFRIDWPHDDGQVLIVIPTKDRMDLLKTAIESIETTCKDVDYRIVVIDHESSDPAALRYLAKIGKKHTIMPYAGPFNYAKMNNLAAKKHGKGAKYILFCNNDVEAIEPGWLSRMRDLNNRDEVGIVGCLLLYGDKRVQHGGVIVGFHGAAEHAMKFIDGYLGNGDRHPGYNCNLTTTRDYSAVTAACMLIRRDVFEEVKGFDESFAVGFNDTDLCLRVVERGYKVLYDGFSVLFHHESATRSEKRAIHHPEDDERLRRRWWRYFVQADPFYSPLLSEGGTDHTLRSDDGCKREVRPRVVTLKSHTAPAIERPPARTGSRTPKRVAAN